MKKPIVKCIQPKITLNTPTIYIIFNKIFINKPGSC